MTATDRREVLLQAMRDAGARCTFSVDAPAVGTALTAASPDASKVRDVLDLWGLGIPERAGEVAAAIVAADPDRGKSGTYAAARRAAVRDAIAFGIMATDEVWHGSSWDRDSDATDKRLDDLVEQYLAQDGHQ